MEATIQGQSPLTSPVEQQQIHAEIMKRTKQVQTEEGEKSVYQGGAYTHPISKHTMVCNHPEHAAAAMRTGHVYERELSAEEQKAVSGVADNPLSNAQQVALKNIDEAMKREINAEMEKNNGDISPAKLHTIDAKFKSLRNKVIKG